VAIDATAEADTFPKLLLRNARKMGTRPAMRHKDLGIWQVWTWAQALEEIRALSVGLEQLGLERGATFAVIGSNRPRLYWAICAGQALGAVPVPVYADAGPEEMAFVLEHAEASIVVVQDQEQVDKILAVAPQLPRLARIIYDEPRGLSNYAHGRLQAFAEVQRLGRQALEADGGRTRAWEARIAAANGSDLGVILYTSGTTGRPKGVMLSFHNAIISSGNASAFDKLDQNEEVIAYLPLAWIGDHMFSYAQSYVTGYCVSCPETPDTVTEDRREIGATYAFAPPRVYENLLTLTMVRMEDAGALKRKMVSFFLAFARRWGERILNREPVPGWARLGYWVGELLVYGPLKNRYGFSRVRVAYTAGEAIGPEIFRFFRALGINLKQLYGQTEASVYISAQPDAEIYADTVGKPSPGIEIKMSETGEVMFRSPGAFVGYYKDPERTHAVRTVDGFVRTGDAGFLDPHSGHLKIIDRAKDVGRLTNGTLFAPKYLENKLKFFPNIKEVVAFGKDRDFVCVMVNIDLVAVGSWAERQNVAYGSYQELAAHPRVYEMIARHIEEVNGSLILEGIMAGAKIKRFLVLHKELDPDDGELTRTQKVRREFIAERYGALVKALYDGSNEADVATEVMFEDGRKGILSARIKIWDLASAANGERDLDQAA
jgi:long-chain acyl-CoA synthetase